MDEINHLVLLNELRGVEMTNLIACYFGNSLGEDNDFDLAYVLLRNNVATQPSLAGIESRYRFLDMNY